MNSDSSQPENPKQPAYLFAKFQREFPSDEACLTELYRLFKIEIKCRLCNNPDLQIMNNGRVGSCSHCKTETWFTSGTFLERMKLPRPRLAAVWLTMKGAVLNSLSLSKLFDIAPSSAHAILKWVRFALQAYLPADCPVVHSSLFKAVFSRRSRETPARAHPVAEQDEMERTSASVQAWEHPSSPADAVDCPSDEYYDCPDTAQSDKNSGSSKSAYIAGDDNCSAGESQDQEERVSSLISDSPVHFDELYLLAKLPVGELSAALTMLELSGKVERLAGDLYIKVKPKPKIKPPDPELLTTISEFLAFVRDNFGGISRRYLQCYLAAYMCHLDRNNWSKEDLWQSCFASLAASHRQIRNHVCPLFVKLSAA